MVLVDLFVLGLVAIVYAAFIIMDEYDFHPIKKIGEVRDEQD